MPVLLAALGMFGASLDSAVNVALPGMAEAFGVGPAAIRWVIIGYVLTYALTALLAGLAADRVGAGPVFTLGLVASAGVFLGYGLAPSYAAVLGLRVAQGVAGGLVYGAAPALVTLSVPPERRGRGLGLMTLGLGAGLALGPVVSGLLVQAWSWRAAFVFRAPVMAAVAASSLLAPPPRGVAAAPRGFLGLSEMLRWPVARAAALALLANCAQFAVWLLAPFYLIAVRGLPPPAAGLAFTLAPLATALGGPAGGWQADRRGPRGPVRAGLALETAGLLLLAWSDADSSLGVAALGLVLVGLGVGVFQVPNLADLMGAFPRARQGAAGGLGFLARTLGSASGAQLAGAVFAVRVGGHGMVGAMQAAFLVAAAVAALGLGLALAPRPGPDRADRRPE